MKKSEYEAIEVLKIVLYACSTYLLWQPLSPAALAYPYEASNIPNPGWAVIGGKSKQTFPLVNFHCLIEFHLHRHSGGSSMQQQAKTFSKHPFHFHHFWSLTLVIRYMTLGLPGIRTLHLPVGYLTPCNWRFFFPNLCTAISIIWTKYSSTHMPATSKWYSINFKYLYHFFNSFTWIPFSTRVHFCSAQFCRK